MTTTRTNLFAVLAILLLPMSATAVPIVIDNSPDATGAATTQCCWVNTDISQIVGDLFTLEADTILSGASIFSGIGFGAVGDFARMRIWDDVGGIPGSLLVDLVTTIDLVDAIGTSIDQELQRLHATFSDTFLGAGTYWFSMAGFGASFTQATGAYDDSSFRFGPSALTNTCNAVDIGCTDAFFQLEGRVASVPEPSTLALFGLGLLGLGFARRRA